jgi:hypothetical protein
MENLSAAWLYPIIIIAGALQAWEPPMNNALVGTARGLGGSLCRGRGPRVRR